MEIKELFRSVAEAIENGFADVSAKIEEVKAMIGTPGNPPVDPTDPVEPADDVPALKQKVSDLSSALTGVLSRYESGQSWDPEAAEIKTAKDLLNASPSQDGGTAPLDPGANVPSDGSVSPVDPDQQAFGRR